MDRRVFSIPRASKKVACWYGKGHHWWSVTELDRNKGENKGYEKEKTWPQRNCTVLSLIVSSILRVGDRSRYTVFVETCILLPRCYLCSAAECWKVTWKEKNSVHIYWFWWTFTHCCSRPTHIIKFRFRHCDNEKDSFLSNFSLLSRHRRRVMWTGAFSRVTFGETRIRVE